MDTLDNNSRRRISFALAQLAYALNTPFKVDLAIMYHDGDITSEGQFNYAIRRGEPFVGKEAVEMLIVSQQIEKFEDLCSNICGVNFHQPVNDKVDNLFRRVLRRFGSPENAKLFELAIVYGTDGLLEEESLAGVSWVDGEHLVGLAVLAEDFIEAVASLAENDTDARKEVEQ